MQKLSTYKVIKVNNNATRSKLRHGGSCDKSAVLYQI